MKSKFSMLPLYRQVKIKYLVLQQPGEFYIAQGSRDIIMDLNGIFLKDYTVSENFAQMKDLLVLNKNTDE